MAITPGKVGEDEEVEHLIDHLLSNKPYRGRVDMGGEEKEGPDYESIVVLFVAVAVITYAAFF